MSYRSLGAVRAAPVVTAIASRVPSLQPACVGLTCTDVMGSQARGAAERARAQFSAELEKALAAERAERARFLAEEQALEARVVEAQRRRVARLKASRPW